MTSVFLVQWFNKRQFMIKLRKDVDRQLSDLNPGPRVTESSIYLSSWWEHDTWITGQGGKGIRTFRPHLHGASSPSFPCYAVYTILRGENSARNLAVKLCMPGFQRGKLGAEAPCKWGFRPKPLVKFSGLSLGENVFEKRLYWGRKCTTMYGIISTLKCNGISI